MPKHKRLVKDYETRMQWSTMQLEKRIRDLYKLIWNDFQHILLNRKSKMEKSLCGIIHFCIRNMGKSENI